LTISTLNQSFQTESLPTQTCSLDMALQAQLGRTAQRVRQLHSRLKMGIQSLPKDNYGKKDFTAYKRG